MDQVQKQNHDDILRTIAMIKMTGNLLGQDPRPIVRKNIRRTFPRIDNGQITNIIETVLALLKKYEFSLHAHNNLYILAGKFMKNSAHNNNEPNDIPLTIDCFEQGLIVWMEDCCDQHDHLMMQENPDDFTFVKQ